MIHDSEVSNFIINCFAFALELENSDIYKQMCYYEGYDGVKPDFIKYLIDEKLLKETDPFENCFVMYFLDNKPVHAGRLIVNNSNNSKKIVKSRWGNRAAVLTHALDLVPNEYGCIENVVYYHPMNQLTTEKHIRKYHNLTLTIGN